MIIVTTRIEECANEREEKNNKKEKEKKKVGNNVAALLGKYIVNFANTFDLKFFNTW